MLRAQPIPLGPGGLATLTVAGADQRLGGLGGVLFTLEDFLRANDPSARLGRALEVQLNAVLRAGSTSSAATVVLALIMADGSLLPIDGTRLTSAKTTWVRLLGTWVQPPVTDGVVGLALLGRAVGATAGDLQAPTAMLRQVQR